MNPVEALTAALALAIAAPTEEKSEDALAIAESLGQSLSEHEIARAKRDAWRLLHVEESSADC